MRRIAGAPVSLEEIARLQAAAKQLGLSFPDLVRTLLLSALEDFESGDLTFTTEDTHGTN